MIKIFLLLFVFSCASKPSGEVQYFSGTTVIRSAQNNKILAKIPVLMRRTVDPFAKKMLEEIIQLHTRQKHNETLISYEFIQGHHFAIQDEARLIRGHAYFHGPEWKWTHWTVHFSQIDGSVIQGKVERTKEGLLGTKSMTKPSGAKLSIEEQFSEIDLVTFKAMKRNRNK